MPKESISSVKTQPTISLPHLATRLGLPPRDNIEGSTEIVWHPSFRSLSWWASKAEGISSGWDCLSKLAICERSGSMTGNYCKWVPAFLSEGEVKLVTVDKQYRDWDALLSPTVEPTVQENGDLPTGPRKPRLLSPREWSNRSSG